MGNQVKDSVTVIRKKGSQAPHYRDLTTTLIGSIRKSEHCLRQVKHTAKIASIEEVQKKVYNWGLDGLLPDTRNEM